uniref:Myosin heavy chain, non-muscle-like n=1 Tax=Saccoglossus kowalevskii TaxID=10224 RepID=A0ABM0GRY4_SACKO|nr:PREDICTED: myosin heavy chain, non-muscle-like [Saccoglossus kowalevskii]
MFPSTNKVPFLTTRTPKRCPFGFIDGNQIRSVERPTKQPTEVPKSQTPLPDTLSLVISTPKVELPKPIVSVCEESAVEAGALTDSQYLTNKCDWPDKMPSDVEISLYVKNIIENALKTLQDEQIGRLADVVLSSEKCDSATNKCSELTNGNHQVLQNTSYCTSSLRVTSEDSGACTTSVGPTSSLRVDKVTRKDCGTCTTPLAAPILCDAESNTQTQAEFYEASSSTMTTPTLRRDIDQGCSPIKPDMIDSASSPQAPPSSSISTMTTPKKHFNIETMDFAMYTSLGPTLVDASTDTSPVASREIETMVTPKSVVSVAASPIPIDKKDVCLGMTPMRGVDEETSITPACTPINSETMTTPLVVPPVFSMDDYTAGKSNKLLDNLESTTIRNELLRKENNELKKAKSSLSVDLTCIKVELSEQMDKIRKVKEETRNEMQKEIDTILAQNGDQMNEIGKLSSVITQKNEEIAALEEQQKTDKRLYQEEIHNFQIDLKTIYKQHKDEISALKLDNALLHHYKEACKKIDLLEEEVDKHVRHAQVLERKKALMTTKKSELATLTEHLKKQATIIEQNNVYLCEKDASLRMREENVSEREKKVFVAESETRELQKEALEAIKAKKSLQLQYEDLMLQLHESTAQIADIVSDVNNYKEEILTLTLELEKSHKENSELKEENQKVLLEGEVIEGALKLQEEEIIKQKKRAEDAENKMVVLNGEIEKECRQAFDDLNSMMDRINVLKKENEQKDAVIRKQADEIQQNSHFKVLCSTLEEQLQNIQSQFAENKDFMEQEHRTIAESLQETEDNLKVEHLELSQKNVLLEEKLEECRQLKDTVEKIGSELDECQTELDNTKAQAQWMIYKRSYEISAASQVVVALREDIYSMLEFLRGKLGTSQDEVSKNSKHQDQPQGSVSSLVSSVLNAVRSNNDISTGDPDKRPTLSGSDSSAFHTIQSTPDQPADCSTDPENTAESAKKQDATLGDQLVGIRDMLTDVCRLVQVLESAGCNTIKELKETTALLTSNMERLKERYNFDIELVKDQLRESESREKKMQHDLKNKRSELFEKEQALDYANKKIAELAANLSRFPDQQSHIQVQRLKLSILEKDEYYQAQSTTATRHATTLRENWKRAEAEIFKLDEMIEVVRKTLEQESDVVQRFPKLIELAQYVEGKDS